VAKASTPVNDATAPTPVRVSTGVTLPVLLGLPTLYLPQSLSTDLLPADGQVELSLTVDANGMPQNVKVVKSFSNIVDDSVIATVSKMHFRPGTVDNLPTAVDLNLTVNVTR
jgi:TonB family protein